MSETASIALSPDHAKQFVQQLSHEGRAVLFRAMYSQLIDPDMLEELNVEGQTIAQIQAGEKPKVVCPHVGCEEMYSPSDLKHISHNRRVEEIVAYSYDHDNEVGNVVIENFGESDGWEWGFEALFCPRCQLPVKLPRKWGLGKRN